MLILLPAGLNCGFVVIFGQNGTANCINRDFFAADLRLFEILWIYLSCFLCVQLFIFLLRLSRKCNFGVKNWGILCRNFVRIANIQLFRRNFILRNRRNRVISVNCALLRTPIRTTRRICVPWREQNRRCGIMRFFGVFWPTLLQHFLRINVGFFIFGVRN